jgi:hypothetical protein
LFATNAAPFVAAGERTMNYIGILALVLTWWGLEAAAVAASAVETTHIFGFTAGSDVGDDPEIEMENTARLGKRTESYKGFLSTFEARLTPINNLRLGPTLTFSRYDIAGVAGLSDLHQTTVQGASFKVKYRLLERDKAWFGLTLVAEPGWGRLTTGVRRALPGTAVALRSCSTVNW